jgi:Protein of unknown function (DUF3617)
MKPLALALLALATLPAAAQTAPPIKPGLWTVEKYESSGDGAPNAGQRKEMADALKNMPPEQRAQMEAMMKQRGIDMGAMASGGGPQGMKMCYDRASLDQNAWQGEQGRCKTDFTQRSATAWKWTSACTQPPSTGQGEARFDGADRYTVDFTSTVTEGGKPRTSRHTMTMRRLGDDCGGLKPIQQMRPPQRP